MSKNEDVMFFFAKPSKIYAKKLVNLAQKEPQTDIHVPEDLQLVPTCIYNTHSKGE